MHETRGLESALTSIMPSADGIGDRPDDSRGRADSAPARLDHFSWHSVGAGAVSLATPVSIGMLHPVLGEVIAIIEVAIVLTVIGTALFGSPALSERAFRLLRWIRNRPEPRTPASGHLSDGGMHEETGRNRGNRER